MSTPSPTAAPAATPKDGVKLLIKVGCGIILVFITFIVLLIIGVSAMLARYQEAKQPKLSSWDTTKQSHIRFTLQPGQTTFVRAPWNGPTLKFTAEGHVVTTWPVNPTGQQIGPAVQTVGSRNYISFRDAFGPYEWLAFHLPGNATLPTTVTIFHF